MCLNHPQTIPYHHPVEKLPSTKTVPSAKKVGNRLQDKEWGLQSQIDTDWNTDPITDID